MEDLKIIIAKNLRNLRAASELTQSELAERINYSDKAISKWERAESLPDIQVLKQLADIYQVSVDYMLNESHSPAVQSEDAVRIIKKNRFIITLLAVSVVWLIATIAFVLLELITDAELQTWLSYVVAVPVSCIVLLVFNSIWGRHKLNFIIISVLVWSLLLIICLVFNIKNIWLIFVIGIPAQIIIALWSRLKFTKIGTLIHRASKK